MCITGAGALALPRPPRRRVADAAGRALPLPPTLPRVAIEGAHALRLLDVAGDAPARCTRRAIGTSDGAPA